MQNQKCAFNNNVNMNINYSKDSSRLFVITAASFLVALVRIKARPGLTARETK